MRRIRIRATLSSPVAVPHSHDVHIDALLAWVWFLRHFPDRLDSIARDVQRKDVLQAHLPVARLQVGPHAVPVASAWIFPADARLCTTRWTRKKDADDMDQRARTMNASCPDRPQLNRGDCVETPWIEWLAWGDKHEVERALLLVHHIGGLRGMGYGKVAGWDVARDDSIISTSIWVKAGVAQRNLPEEAIEPALCERIAVEPPYWPPCMQVSGVRAGADVSLRPEIVERLDALS